MKIYSSLLILLVALIPEAQQFREPDLERLTSLPGTVHTYHSKGCESKARYLQALVQDAVHFFEAQLQDSFDIQLRVLSRADWKSFVGGSRLIPQFSKDPDRIEMGVYHLMKIKLPENETLYGQKEIFFWDFVAVHELGHYISSQKKVKSIRWTSEFFADYIMIGFLLEKVPDWKLPSSISFFYKYLPFKYKSLEDYDQYYSRIGILNNLIYQARFEELAIEIFQESGWDFLDQYIDRFTREINPPPDKDHLVALTISEFQKMEPEIVNVWLADMKKSYHPFLIIIPLLLIVISIRSVDCSYAIFTDHGLSSRKRHRITGVPTLLILSSLKHFKNQQKRRLKVIAALRPIMYLALLLLVLLLLLHH